jgi:hypothetical protein
MEIPAIGCYVSNDRPEELCDLGYVTKDGFDISTYVVPHNFTGRLVQAGKLRVEILAVADNGQSQPLHLEVSWDGRWSDSAEEVAKHLVIKSLPASP